MPELTYQDEPEGIDFLVEFIGVEDSPLLLEKYRNLMSRFFGPANGILVEQGTLHAFIALETSAVLSEVNGVPAWNQLHISDDWDVSEEVDWEAVYSELFRREFSCELDAVWDELPPVHERPINYCGRLVPSLVVRQTGLIRRSNGCGCATPLIAQPLGTPGGKKSHVYSL